jgi:hypothetical protein
MLTVTERSRLPLTFKLFDGDTLPATPATLRYRIDCETTGKTLQDWTTLTPASVVSLVVPSSINAIQSRANPYELKTFTVEANTGTDNAFNDAYSWRVKNLFGVT